MKLSKFFFFLICTDRRLSWMVGFKNTCTSFVNAPRFFLEVWSLKEPRMYSVNYAITCKARLFL